MKEYTNKHGKILSVERTDQYIRIHSGSVVVFDANIANTDVAAVESRVAAALRRFGVESAQYP